MSDELPLKDHQNEEVTQSFCQLKLLLKMHTAYPMQEKHAATPALSKNSIFHY